MRHLERRGENHPVADKPSAKINPERLKASGAGTRQRQLVGPGSTNGQKGMSGAESLVLTLINSGVETCLLTRAQVRCILRLRWTAFRGFAAFLVFSRESQRERQMVMRE